MTAESPTLRAAEPTVLLIDDDDVFVGLVSRTLETRGFHVATALTVGDAERALAGDVHPALILLDINLPDDTGWALLRHPAFIAAGSPPVVIVSGTQLRPQRLREYGVAGYLPKPVAMAALISCVRRLISGDKATSPVADEVLL